MKIGESVVAPVFDMKDGTLALWRGLGEDEGLLEIWRGGARVSGLKLREQLARIDLDPETLEVTAADVHGSTYRYDMKEQVRTRRTPFGTRGGSRLLAASEGLEVVVVDDAPSGSRRTSSPSALRSWDVDTGKLKAKRRRPRGAILRCAAEAGGKTACVTSSSTIEVYEEGGPDDETLGTIPHALQRLTGLEFTPDGEHVMVIGRPLRAIASAHDTLRIVRVEDAALTHKIDLLPGRVTSVLSHPDGRRLFLGFEDGLIYEWDLDMFEVKSALNPEPTR